MNRINIDGNYWIDASDRSNFTLKTTIPATRRDDGTMSNPRDEVHGYFGSFRQALQHVVDEQLHDGSADGDLKAVLAELRAIHAAIQGMPDLSKVATPPAVSP